MENAKRKRKAAPQQQVDPQTGPYDAAFKRFQAAQAGKAAQWTWAKLIATVDDLRLRVRAPTQAMSLAGGLSQDVRALLGQALEGACALEQDPPVVRYIGNRFSGKLSRRAMWAKMTEEQRARLREAKYPVLGKLSEEQARLNGWCQALQQAVLGVQGIGRYDAAKAPDALDAIAEGLRKCAGIPAMPAESAPAASPAPAANLTTPDDDPTPQYVTLDQAAARVGKGKRTLEYYKGNGLPAPDVKGGGGKPDEWEWSKMRDWLQATFGRKLSARLPDPFRAGADRN